MNPRRQWRPMSRMRSGADRTDGAGSAHRADPLSFSLDKDKLIVNGMQQPEDLFRLFKAKYIHDPKDHFVYMRDGASVIVGVSVK